MNDIEDRLEALIPQGDGYNSEYAHTLVEAVEAPRKAKLLSAAEIEALRRDAERYRHIRELAWYVDAAARVYDIGNQSSPWLTERYSVDADEIESAIDAAMAQQEAP